MLLRDGLFLKSIRKIMAELCHFGSYHGPAVALERILLEVFLMVIFGDIKLVERRNFGNERVIPNLGCTDLTDDFFGNFLLLLIAIENGRAVLRADIIALAVKGGRVVDGEKTVSRSL